MIKKAILLVSLALGSVVQAQDSSKTIEVMKRDFVFGGERVRVRQAVNQHLRAQGLDPNDYVLEGVSLRARALERGVTATLVVGQDKQTKRLQEARFSRRDLEDIIIDRILRDKKPKDLKTLDWNLSDSPGTQEERWQMLIDGDARVISLQAHVRTKTEKVVIRVDETLRRHESLTVRLRQELRRKGYSSRDLVLKRVTLVAKSKRGLADARLQVGEQRRDRVQTIASARGGERAFRSDDLKSYNRISWNVRPRRQDGKWQVHVNSNRNRVKIRAVVVEVAPK